MRSLLLIVMMLGSARAFATAGVNAAALKYQSPKDQKGLCTPDNSAEPYWKEGYCLSLTEQLKKNECTKKAVEELRQRMLPEEKRTAAFKEAKSIGTPTCESKDGNKHFEDILKDKDKFTYYIMQRIAMTTVQESGWDVLNNEQAGSKGPGGLLNMSLDKGGVTDMENKDYKCGCKDQVVTTSGQSNVLFKGQSPGPLDGHHSETCGAYVFIKNALKDGEIASGNSKQPDPEGKEKDSRKGAARAWKTQEARLDENDKKQIKAEEWRTEKNKNFCEKYWASPDSKTTPWKLIDGQDAATSS